ncbi:glycosyltransferase family 2 protein [Salinisphaera sp. RV14]|uniref:glycosyltransferase family 2 protein n=1 Tax=Salinisphaera sp. RV14 TaxID=3454140 RepID=UPI003F83B034
MNTQPFVSVIVPAYNIADYIGPCLTSLLVPEATQCEIIVVDDGSTDATPEVIAGYDDPRLRVIRQANGGLGSARNTGLDAAQGHYILFVDGDDWVEPDLIPQCISHIQRYPDADLFVFDYVDITEHGSEKRICGNDFWGAKSSAWNKLFKQTLIGNDRFDEDIFYEDLAVVRPWVARAAEIQRIDAVLYNYRFARWGSIMNSFDVQRLLDLPLAVNRCVARIESDARQRGMRSPAERLGQEWKTRLYTFEAFIQGVINRGQQLPDRHIRINYVKQFIDRLNEPESVDTEIIQRHHGLLVAVASRCHLIGAHALGDLLLHGLGEIKNGLRSKFGFS